jgi:tetratricopeptide (TPR) repeat protein
MDVYEEAIRMARAAVQATPKSSPNYAIYLNNLGSELGYRYETMGEMEDLRESIHVTQTAIDFTPPDHPYQAIFLSNLAKTSVSLYERTMILDHLQKAIQVARRAVETTPPDDPDRARRLNILGMAIGFEYERTEEIDDLEEAIRVAREAIENTPKDHPYLATYMSSLGSKLGSRYDKTGAIGDLQEAISVSWLAVEATPLDHPSRAIYLHNLGNRLESRYTGTGGLDDLHEAIRIGKDVIKATPQNHPNRAVYLNSLGSRLGSQYEITLEMDNLKEAIQLIHDAVETTPLDHPDRAMFMSSKANLLGYQYERTGALGDLQQAIQLEHDIIKATAPYHFRRALRLNNLSVRLASRYERTGQMDDLQEAIRLGRDAVQATPNDHPKRTMYMSNLGSKLRSRYERTGAPSDIQEAIQVTRCAIEATPLEDPDRARMLNILGMGLKLQYERTQELDKLEEAIKVMRNAVETAPKDHPELARYLNNLGYLLELQYDRAGVVDDLDQAIRHSRHATETTPRDNPDQARYWNSLGNRLAIKYEKTGLIELLEESTCAFTESLNVVSGPPLHRLQSGRAAGENHIRMERWQKAAECLTTALDLLPKVTPRSISRDDQQYTLNKISGLASLAASAILKNNKNDSLRALQALEAGRGIIASLLINSRDDVSQLNIHYPNLCARYIELRETVASPLPSLSGGGSVTDSTLATEGGRTTLLSEAISRRLQDVEALEDIEREIRRKPEFERFQLAPTKEDFIKLAKHGPIVSFNTNHISSHAFLITGIGIQPLSLPDLKIEDLEKNIVLMTRWGHSGRRDAKFVSDDDEPKVEGGSSTNHKPSDMLLWLWRVAVRPILEELGVLWQGKAPDKLPCIWWVGGGLMAQAPLHAAGDHAPGSTENTLSHVVSSFTPTIKALDYSRKKAWKLYSTDRNKILVVAMPKTPGHSDLRVNQEVAAIEKHVGPQAFINVLENPSKEAVLKELESCTVAHFACHGYSDPEEPSNSALILGKSVAEPLTIRDLGNITHQLAQVAYLSACSTAEISTRNLVDESIHLANMFQLIGFRHVIGAMFGAHDSAAVEVAAEFYDCLLRKGTDTDTDNVVPYALHAAVQCLRNKDGSRDNFLRWVPFIHVGP